MSIESSCEVKVKVHRHTPQTMILRVSLGTGNVEGEEFDISYATSGSPIWRFHDEGRYYSVDLQELTGRVIEARGKLRNGEGGAC